MRNLRALQGDPVSETPVIGDYDVVGNRWLGTEVSGKLRSCAGSELQEDFPLVQPVAQTPHEEEHGACLRHGSGCPDELVVKREDSDGTIQPFNQNDAQRIDENRIHAHDDERKRPSAVAAHLNEPIKPDEHEEHPTEAIQDEGRCADLFDEGNPRV